MVKQTRHQSSQCGELRLQIKDQVIKVKVDDYYLFNSDFYSVDLNRYKLNQARAEV